MENCQAKDGQTKLESVLVRVNDKNYYVKYDDLINKANDKLYAYEDQKLQKNATINGKNIILNKKKIEDKLKGDIKMDSRMPGAAKTEQKLREYIRKQIINILNEQEDAPSEEERIAQEKAAKEAAKKAAYKRFFSQALAKFGVSSVNSIPKEKRKEFFDYVDANWTSKQEAPVKEEFGYEKYKGNIGDRYVDSEGNEFVVNGKVKGGVSLRGQGGEIEKSTSDLLKMKKIDKKNNLTEMWKEKLQKNYDNDYNQFVEYDKIYNIAKRLGFKSAQEAWKANPLIQGSTNPNDLKVMNKNKDTMISAGSYVFVEPTAPGLQASYPAAKWLKNKMKVRLIDDAPNSGTLDVLNVELPDGRQESIYDFNIVDEINETSSTGGVAGYMTPNAFTGQKGVSKKQKQIANQLGYELVDKSYSKNSEGNPEDLGEDKELNEGLDSYYFKDDELTNESKLGLAIRQMRNSLQEVEKLMQKSIKLKTENNVDTSKLGKRAYASLKRINEKTIRLMIALNDLK